MWPNIIGAQLSLLVQLLMNLAVFLLHASLVDNLAPCSIAKLAGSVIIIGVGDHGTSALTDLVLRSLPRLIKKIHARYCFLRVIFSAVSVALVTTIGNVLVAKDAGIEVLSYLEVLAERSHVLGHSLSQILVRLDAEKKGNIKIIN